MKKKFIRNLIGLFIGVLVLGVAYTAISSFKSNSQTPTTASTSSENSSEDLGTKSKSDNQNNDSDSNNTKSDDENASNSSNNAKSDNKNANNSGNDTKGDDKNTNINSNKPKSNAQNTDSSSNENTDAQKHFNYSMDSNKYNEFVARLRTIEKNDTEENEKADTTYEITMYAVEYNKQYDTLLNDIYNYLKVTMPESEFKRLQDEEVKWINKKETAIKEGAEKHKGGSIMAYLNSLTSLGYTHDRIKELLEQVK